MKDQLQKQVDDLIGSHSVVAILDCIAQNAIDHARALDNVQGALKPFVGELCALVRQHALMIRHVSDNMDRSAGLFVSNWPMLAQPYHKNRKARKVFDTRG